MSTYLPDFRASRLPPSCGGEGETSFSSYVQQLLNLTKKVEQLEKGINYNLNLDLNAYVYFYLTNASADEGIVVTTNAVTTIPEAGTLKRIYASYESDDSNFPLTAIISTAKGKTYQVTFDSSVSGHSVAASCSIDILAGDVLTLTPKEWGYTEWSDDGQTVAQEHRTPQEELAGKHVLTSCAALLQLPTKELHTL